MGAVEGEQKGRAMTAPAEGPARGRAAEALPGQPSRRMRSPATVRRAALTTMRLGAARSGHEVQLAASAEGRKR